MGEPSDDLGETWVASASSLSLALSQRARWIASSRKSVVGSQFPGGVWAFRAGDAWAWGVVGLVAVVCIGQDSLGVGVQAGARSMSICRLGSRGGGVMNTEISTRSEEHTSELQSPC